MIIYAHNISSPAASAASTTSLLLQPWFVVLVLAGAIERLTGLAYGVSFEREWVVFLAGINYPISLAKPNAMLNRVDFLCEDCRIINFWYFVGKIWSCGSVTSLKLVAALMMCALLILILFGISY